MSSKIIFSRFFSALLISSCFLLLSACKLLPEADTKSESFISVSFIDVGQGDAALISSPENRHFLIDAGNENEKILAALHSRNILELAAVIITHPDLDHFGSILAILDEFKIKRFILPNDSALTPQWSECLNVILRSSARQERMVYGDTLVISDEAYLRFLWPVRSSDYSGNNQSYTMKMVYGSSRILFTGDINQEIEFNLLKIGVDLSSDILKVAHHGSRTSSSLPFLAAVNPIWAVISCDSSVYGHPHAEVVNGIKSIIADSSFILRTDHLNDLEFALYPSLIQFQD